MTSLRRELTRPYAQLLTTIAIFAVSLTVLISCTDELPQGKTPQAEATSTRTYAPPCDVAMHAPTEQDCTNYYENLTQGGFQPQDDGSFTRP